MMPSVVLDAFQTPVERFRGLLLHFGPGDGQTRRYMYSLTDGLNAVGPHRSFSALFARTTVGFRPC